MTATGETTDGTMDGAPIDGVAVGEKAQPAPPGTDLDPDVAEAAARDVARLLDRRGLRDVVALAHRVLRESTRLTPAMTPRADDTEGIRCTLRQHERSTRRGAAGRAVDDDRA
jgi:hypothetical protein